MSHFCTKINTSYTINYNSYSSGEHSIQFPHDGYIALKTNQDRIALYRMEIRRTYDILYINIVFIQLY